MNRADSDDGIHRLERRSALRFSLAEYKSRVELLKAALVRHGVDLYIGTMPEHLNYFTGFDPTGVFYYQLFVLTPSLDEPILLTSRGESELARISCWIDDIRIWHSGEDPIERTIELIRELHLPNRRTVGLELDNWYLKPSTYLRLVSELEHARFIDVTHIGLDLRLRKSPAELEYMRAAARLADAGMAAAIDVIRPGVSEVAVRSAVQTAMEESEYPAFPNPLIGSGPRSGLFHGLPTSRIIEQNDPVEVEIAGVVARYNSNLCRTFVAGRASPRVRALYEIVREAYQRGLDAVRPGVPASEIDRICQDVRRRAGYGEYIVANSGYGVELGYPPVWIGSLRLAADDEHIFEPGFVFSLEPSIAQCDGITVILGNGILVTDNGAEELHQSPFELLELF